MNDIINGLFELGGAVLTWKNFLTLYRERDIKGVYWPIFGFFAAWGIWNLYYYPSLGQWFSFGAGVILVMGNIFWIVMATILKLRKKS